MILFSGFYWTGAYASENYLVFGSDDGAGDAYTSILYSVNTHTGQLIDKRTDMIGDDGKIGVTCEFCSEKREFDPKEFD